mmetsp:Transcript_5791/g.7810  ORF Transcript_5791/g.7810 Transcript_5791/m.7810 type:complete len:256 (-) Transcript_5791:1093-1860(-)
MLPIPLELVDEVLDLEANARLDLRVSPLFKHLLQAVLEVVERNDRRLRLVLLLLLLAATLDLVFPSRGVSRLLRNSRGYWVRFGVGDIRALLARLAHSVRREGVKHAAEHLNVARGKLLEELVKARLHDVAIDHIQVEQFNNQAHIAMHLVLLLHLQLVLVKDEKHLFVEVLRKIVLDHGLFERGSSLSTVHLLALQHLVELSLAARQEQLFKIHLGVVLVVKLLEEAHAQLDVEIQESRLSRALHENDLHQLLQ